MEKNVMNETERPSLTCFDSREHWRCPILGGPVPFSYCRSMNRGWPCSRLAGCWKDHLDIQAYLKDNFTDEEIGRILAQPAAGRMETIFATLRRIREQNSNQG